MSEELMEETLEQETIEENTGSDYSEPTQDDYTETVEGSVDESVDSSPEGSAELDLSDVFSETPDSPQTNQFQQTVEQLGIDVGEGNPQDALVNAYNQAMDYNTQWQDYHQQQQEYQQQLQSQYQQQLYEQQQAANYGYQQMQQQQQQQLNWQNFQDELQSFREEEAIESEGQWWTPPQIDEQEIALWRETVTNPETGEVEHRWKHNTPPEIISEANQYVRYHQDWQESLANRPHEVLPEIIEAEFDKLFVDRYGALLDEFEGRQEEQYIDEVVEDIDMRNADWVYQLDQAGNIMTDGYGQPLVTPAGQQVIGIINNLRQSGLEDPEALWDTATQILSGQYAQQSLGQYQQQAQYAQQVQARNMRHLQQGASSIPNREGSEAPAENPSPISQNQALSPGDKLRQQALADGLF